MNELSNNIVLSEQEIESLIKNGQIKLDNKSQNSSAGKDPNDMSFIEHLTEMRKRLTIIFISFVILFLVYYLNSVHLMAFVLNIANKLQYSMTYIKPQEIFIERIRLSFICALITNIPIFMWHFCAFIAPSFEEESIVSIKLGIFSLITLTLFLIGMYFSYKLLMPAVFLVLKNIGDASNIPGMITVESFVSLFTTITLALGLSFELPIATALLTWIGVVTPEIMRKGFGFAVLVIFIVAAIITPPDVISQCIVGLPLIALYVLSILVSYLVNSFTSKKSQIK